MGVLVTLEVTLLESWCLFGTCMFIKLSDLRFVLWKLIGVLCILYCCYFQTRLQAQAAGVPYQGLCGMHCIETNTVCKQLFFDSKTHCFFIECVDITLVLNVFTGTMISTFVLHTSLY